MALLVDKVRPEQQGLAVSTYFAGFDGGISLGSTGFGVVSQIWGFGIMWPLSAACTLWVCRASWIGAAVLPWPRDDDWETLRPTGAVVLLALHVR